MRGLRHLIPQDMRDSLNKSPAVQWLVIVLMIAAGFLLLVKGINGIRNRRVTGKYGKVFEGSTAVALGVVYAVLGVVIVIVAATVKMTS